MNRNTEMCVGLSPGDNPQVVPKENNPGPPEGFVDNTVYRYRLLPDGTKELIGTMPAFPEGWNNPANFKHRSGQGRPQKESEDDIMKGIKTDENTRAEKVKQAQVLMKNGMTMTKAAETIGIPVGTLAGWLKQEKKKQQTPNPEPVTAANQEPAQGVDKSAVKSVEQLKTEVKDRFTDADDQPIPYAVKVNWSEAWPKAQELLSQGMTQAAAAAELGISIDSLRHKIERERKKEQKASAVDLDTFKVRWIRDVMYEEGLDPSVQLQIVGAIQGLQITQG